MYYCLCEEYYIVKPSIYFIINLQQFICIDNNNSDSNSVQLINRSFIRLVKLCNIVLVLGQYRIKLWVCIKLCELSN